MSHLAGAPKRSSAHDEPDGSIGLNKAFHFRFDVAKGSPVQQCLRLVDPPRYGLAVADGPGDERISMCRRVY